MEMPRIEGASEPRQKDYRAPDPNKKKGGKAKVAVIVIACLLVAAGAAAAATYQMELWGGSFTGVLGAIRCPFTKKVP